MNIVPNLIPTTVQGLYNGFQNLYANIDTKLHATSLIRASLRIAVAACICFAAYKGSLIAAGALATLSLPATTIAAGAMLVKFGYTALKVGVISKQIKMFALGAAALYAGWQALDNPFISSRIEGRKAFTRGLIENSLSNKYNVFSLSSYIAAKLGYK